MHIDKSRIWWWKQRLVHGLLGSPVRKLDRPIFVVGLAGSGTSILWQSLRNCYGLGGPSWTSLQSHPLSPSSLRHDDELKKPAGQIPSAPEFISHYYRNEDHVTEFDRWRLVLFFQQFFEKDNRAIFKNTISMQHVRFIQEVIPDAYFLCMVRDGYACVNHAVRRRSGKRPKNKYPAWMNKDIYVRAALAWTTGYETFLADMRHLKAVRIIRYECLVDDPRAEIESVGKFLGLGPIGQFDLHIPKGQGRNESPVEFLKGRDQWHRDNFPKDHLESVAEIISPLMIRLGYSPQVRD